MGLAMAARDGITLDQKEAWMRETHSGAMAAIPPASIFTERHYTIAEIAGLWNVSIDFVRRLFAEEPGVLVFGDQRNERKRRYTTMRIPESVLKRVHNRVLNARSAV